MSNKKINQLYQLSVEETLNQLNVEPDQGLTAGEVESRQQEYGHNILTKDTGESPFKLFIGQFKDPMIYILIAVFLLMIFLSEWLEAAVVFVIVLANAIIGFAQEIKALKAMDALSKSMETEATVVRDGTAQQIPADQLVPGDIVRCRVGHRPDPHLPLVLGLVSNRVVAFVAVPDPGDEGLITGRRSGEIERSRAGRRARFLHSVSDQGLCHCSALTRLSDSKSSPVPPRA